MSSVTVYGYSNDTNLVLNSNSASIVDTATGASGAPAGTARTLDFTNNSCHHMVIQRSGGDSAYNIASISGYRNFLTQEGTRIAQEHMKGQGDYVTNSDAFERSVADELYALKQRLLALESA